MSKNSPNNYAFIDANNLYEGIKQQKIPLDYRKFRIYLREKYHVKEALFFIGYDPKNTSLYSRLKRDGYKLIFKPAIPFISNGTRKIKGNVDTELVLHAAAIEYDNYDKAVIISSDGDFTCLLKFLAERNKLAKVITPTKYRSMLFNAFSSYLVSLKTIWKNLIDVE